MTVEAPEMPAAIRATPALQPLVRPIELSILIVTWNSERWIERCLQSIPVACEGVEYEVVVVDNASEDSTLSRLPEDVRIVRAATNGGFAAGTNRAFAESRGRYAFLLNPDCELAPRALTLLHDFLGTHPEAAAAAPLLVDESGDSQREFQLRRFAGLRILASQVLLLDKILPNLPLIASYRYRDLDLDKPCKVEQPAAAALMIRREVFEEVGPFDEQFAPAWFEDVDYCRRLAQANKELYVVPAASARHFGGASLENMTFARFTDTWYRNMWRYAQKWLRPGQAEALRWVIIFGMALRCVAALLGFAHADVGRINAFRAYAHVLRRAFERWGTR
jgi:GT2 family glycosyltransferase